MAIDSRRTSGWSFRVDVFAAIVGFVTALLLFPLRFVSSQIFIRTIPLVLGAVCGMYLWSIYRDRPTSSYPTLSPSVTFSLPSFTVAGTALMILLTVVQGTRSIHFFGLAAIVGSMILVQIFLAHSRDFHPGLLLIQIVVFAMTFRFTALVVTPGLIGVDAWTHITSLSGAIATEGAITAIDHDKHFTSPLYHVIVVSAAILYDTSLVTALYLSLGIVMPLSILIVYSATTYLVSARWAVLAAGLYAFADYTVHWGIHLIPTSLGLVFFLGVLLILVRMMRIGYTFRDFLLLVGLSTAVILTHQISTFIMLILLATAVFAQLVFSVGPYRVNRLDDNNFRRQSPVNLFGLLVFDFGLTIFMWSLTPFRRESFLATVLSWFNETLVEGTGFLNLARPTSTGGEGGDIEPGLIDHVVQYLDVLGFLILLATMLVGSLYIIHRRRAEQSVFTLLFAAAVMLLFILGLPLFGIRNFVPTRWFGFLYGPLAILAVIGLRHLVRMMGLPTAVAAMLVVTLLYPGAMILASPSNVDNPVFPNHHEQLAYNEQELAAVSTIGEMTGGPSASDIRPEQVLFTDHPYHTVFTRTHAYYAQPATIDDRESMDTQVTVYRNAQSTEATYFRDSDGFAQRMNVPEEQMCRPDQGTVYTNGEVTFCVSPTMD